MTGCMLTRNREPIWTNTCKTEDLTIIAITFVRLFRKAYGVLGLFGVTYKV